MTEVKQGLCNANFLIDKDIYAAYKALCQNKGWKMGKAMERLILRELKQNQSQPQNIPQAQPQAE